MQLTFAHEQSSLDSRTWPCQKSREALSHVMIEQAQIHFRDPATSTTAMMLCQTLHGCMIVLTNVDWHFRKFIQKDHEEHADSDGFGLNVGKNYSTRFYFVT